MPFPAAGIFVPPVTRWFCHAFNGSAETGGHPPKNSINPLLVNPWGIYPAVIPDSNFKTQLLNFKFGNGFWRLNFFSLIGFEKTKVYL